MKAHPSDASSAKDVAALDALFNEVGAYRNSKDLKELFDFIKKFPGIAPFNAFLIHVQKPGSRYVATAAQWKVQFNRFVKPGARPLVILKPFEPVEFVFELGDTEGDPLPEEALKPFKTSGKLPARAFSFLMQNLSVEGISYHEADHGTGSAGSIEAHEKYQPGADRSKPPAYTVRYSLVVNGNLSEEEKFATIAHELGHLYCGHLGTPDRSRWPDRRGLPKNIIEFEAESVSWLVCERAGISTPSAAYLNNYLNHNAVVPSISLDTVLTATRRIENMASKKIYPRTESREVRETVVK